MPQTGHWTILQQTDRFLFKDIFILQEMHSHFYLKWPHPSSSTHATRNKRHLMGIHALAPLKSCSNLKNKAWAGFRLLLVLILLLFTGWASLKQLLSSEEIWNHAGKLGEGRPEEGKLIDGLLVYTRQKRCMWGDERSARVVPSQNSSSSFTVGYSLLVIFNLVLIAHPGLWADCL